MPKNANSSDIKTTDERRPYPAIGIPAQSVNSDMLPRIDSKIGSIVSASKSLHWNKNRRVPSSEGIASSRQRLLKSKLKNRTSTTLEAAPQISPVAISYSSSG